MKVEGKVGKVEGEMTKISKMMKVSPQIEEVDCTRKMLSVLSHTVSSGFPLLVNLVHATRQVAGYDPLRVYLKSEKMDRNEKKKVEEPILVDPETTEIIHQGTKSVIIRLNQTDNNVVKVASTHIIQNERKMYEKLGEGCKFIRGLKDFGSVTGFDDKFKYLIYLGYGEKISDVIAREDSHNVRALIEKLRKQGKAALEYTH
eukprot:TRINITY_DN5427_c0_g1_i4.p1 TRINITY_DN5427_c0_g1~~TRINITY_DN5427_c0_g1_i4.p1  ORF type:complete len:202 (-),score=38.06 TRINITY_DN5427_c0_g1_i4:356-961(-)